MCRSSWMPDMCSVTNFGDILLYQELGLKVAVLKNDVTEYFEKTEAVFDKTRILSPSGHERVACNYNFTSSTVLTTF